MNKINKIRSKISLCKRTKFLVFKHILNNKLFFNLSRIYVYTPKANNMNTNYKY